jgi:hypothetical protein
VQVVEKWSGRKFKVGKSDVALHCIHLLYQPEPGQDIVLRCNLYKRDTTKDIQIGDLYCIRPLLHKQLNRTYLNSACFSNDNRVSRTRMAPLVIRCGALLLRYNPNLNENNNSATPENEQNSLQVLLMKRRCTLEFTEFLWDTHCVFRRSYQKVKRFHPSKWNHWEIELYNRGTLLPEENSPLGPSSTKYYNAFVQHYGPPKTKLPFPDHSHDHDFEYDIPKYANDKIEQFERRCVWTTEGKLIGESHEICARRAVQKYCGLELCDSVPVVLQRMVSSEAQYAQTNSAFPRSTRIHLSAFMTNFADYNHLDGNEGRFNQSWLENEGRFGEYIGMEWVNVQTLAEQLDSSYRDLLKLASIEDWRYALELMMEFSPSSSTHVHPEKKPGDLKKKKLNGHCIW